MLQLQPHSNGQVEAPLRRGNGPHRRPVPSIRTSAPSRRCLAVALWGVSRANSLSLAFVLQGRDPALEKEQNASISIPRYPAAIFLKSVLHRQSTEITPPLAILEHGSPTGRPPRTQGERNKSDRPRRSRRRRAVRRRHCPPRPPPAATTSTASSPWRRS